jgi:hypothetical protein
MPLVRAPQPWWTGWGARTGADCVPETHPVRHWPATCPWVAAVARKFAQRFPTPTRRGRPPVATRGLWALARPTPATGADEPRCRRWRPVVAVR